MNPAKLADRWPGANDREAREAVSLRAFYLRLLQVWYLLPLCILTGAVIGYVVYFCVHVVYAPAREYAGGARLYLEFSPDAAGNARDYYNAWTWKELITGDEILDVAMRQLIDAGYADEQEATNQVLPYDGTTAQIKDDELQLIPAVLSDGSITRAEVLRSVTVKLPSDLRVMMLTVTNHDPARANLILSAMTAALSSFGETNENFRDIRVLETTPALLLMTTDRTTPAVVLGALLGFLFGIFGLFVRYSCDDALYDTEMCARRFGQPVLGLLPRARDREDERLTSLVAGSEGELRATCAKVLAGAHRIAVFAAAEETDAAAKLTEDLKEKLGSRFGEGSCEWVTLTGAAELAEEGYDAAVIGIPCGRRGCARVDHILSVLQTRDVTRCATILYDADLRYLKRLYRL